MAKAAIGKTNGPPVLRDLSCPSCEREVDIYMASAPVVGAWCACADKAMEITYENTWKGSSHLDVEDQIEA